MQYPSIRIEGAILSSDIIDAIERGEKGFQKAKDFGLDPTSKVKDEIASTWADARDQWRIYARKVESLKEGATGTTETRNFWMSPFLGLLGYNVELAAERRGSQRPQLSDQPSRYQARRLSHPHRRVQRQSGQTASRRRQTHVAPRFGSGIPEPDRASLCRRHQWPPAETATRQHAAREAQLLGVRSRPDLRGGAVCRLRHSLPAAARIANAGVAGFGGRERHRGLSPRCARLRFPHS